MLYSRRDVLRIGLGAGAGLALGRGLLGASPLKIQGGQLMKTVPSSGEPVPAVGLGTASSFSRPPGRRRSTPS